MVISCYSEYKQVGVLSMSTVVFIVCLVLAIVMPSEVLYIVIGCVFVVLAFMNYKLSKLCNIRIEDDKILVTNLFYRKKFLTSDFELVQPTKTLPFLQVYPNTVPSFFYLKLRNGKRFMFQTIRSTCRNYINMDNGKKMAMELTSEIKQFMNVK